MNTARFRAYRRGSGVVIRGKVEVSALSTGPYLIRVSTAGADTWEFRLAYERQKISTSADASWLTLMTHCEPEVPDSVRYLRIALPNDESVVIESCRKE